MDIEKKAGPQEPEQKKDDSKKKWERRLIRVGIVLLLILLLLLLLRTCGAKNNEIVDGVTIGVIDMDEGETNGNYTDLQALVNSIVDENQFLVFIDTRIVCLPDGRFFPRIQNSEPNHHACWVEIVEGDKTIYESDVLQPGYKIERDKLKTKLSEGSHECQALFHVLKGDTKGDGEINVVKVNVTLNQRS